MEGERVVKIFNREHITRHRKEKVSLLAARGLHEQGICFPEGIVTNARGEFVGYIMPRARGNEFRVIALGVLEIIPRLDEGRPG